MRKALFQIGLPLITLGILRFADPSLLFRFAGLEAPFAIWALVITGGVLLLTSPLFKRIDFRPLFGAAAIACFAFAIFCVNSPTLLGARATYVSVLDIFVIFESAFMLSLGALEQKTNAVSIFAIASLVGQLLAHRFRKIGVAFGGALREPRFNS